MAAPILVDEVLAATHRPKQLMDLPFPDAEQQRLARRLREDVIGSQRYFLDDETVAAATVLGVEHPDILLAMMQRARLPFRKVWIEWRQSVALETLNIKVERNAASISGALLEEISKPGEHPIYRITEVITTYDTGQIAVSPVSIVYNLNAPILERMPSLIGQRSDLGRLTGISKEIIDTTLLGKTYSNSDTDISKWLGASILVGADSDHIRERKAAADHRLELCRKLSLLACHTWSDYAHSYSAIMAMPLAVRTVFERSVAQCILDFSGTWRFLTTVLALIQQREYVIHDDMPNAGRRRYVGNKQVPYLQYWRVSLKLPRKVIVRQMIDGVRDALPKPARAIEGYWRARHKGFDPNCAHVDVSETPNRYRCVHCSRPLFFTPSHMRGDSTLGFVKKDRVVEIR